MNGSRTVLLLLLLASSLVDQGCSAGGGTDALGHSNTPQNLQVTSPAGFPLSATGFYRGDTLSSLPGGGTGFISFNVNLSGVVDSGSFTTGDGLSIQWTPTQVWPAGNPGVEGTRFLTSDTLNGVFETLQGNFNPITRSYAGTFGRGPNYDSATPPQGSSMSWGAGFVSEATSARRVERALTLEGQLFTAPDATPDATREQGTAYQMGVKVYDDQSAVVTGTAPDGSSLLIVGKRVVSPKLIAKPSSPK